MKNSNQKFSKEYVTINGIEHFFSIVMCQIQRF